MYSLIIHLSEDVPKRSLKLWVLELESTGQQSTRLNTGACQQQSVCHLPEYQSNNEGRHRKQGGAS